eukprot:10846923-Prorocentrum_lima.AAC.1
MASKFGHSAQSPPVGAASSASKSGVPVPPKPKIVIGAPKPHPPPPTSKGWKIPNLRAPFNQKGKSSRP